MACLHESQVLAFIGGERDETVEEHIDECPQCRQLLAELVRKNKTTDPGLEATGIATPRDPSLDDTGIGIATPRDPSFDDTGIATDRDPVPPTLDPNEWPAGMKVGRYVVLARIGRGGMGTVFRAEDVELARPVALKRLHAGADAESRARLLREAKAAAQLQHPNVVAVYEVDEHAGTPYLAMELVDGVTLTTWLKEKTRSWREIVDILTQAGRGLVAAHERGLVHRDFKPDNVLVDRTGRARVADFGLARAGDAKPSEPHARHVSHDTRLTVTGSLAGTPAYMSPELVEGGAPDPRSDQYAFAITLYEALHGQHPFIGDTAARLWVEMAAGNIRSGGRPAPAWLDKHVRRGLEVDPEKRWPDLASFVSAINRPPRRALWLAAPIVAVLAGGGAIFAMRSGESGPTCDELAAEYKPTYRQQDLARAIPDPTQLALANTALERFTTEYRKSVRESCRATRAGKQSALIGDKRTACLELAKRRAWFVTSGITTGIDRRPGLATLLEELPDLVACNDPEWLARAAPMPVAAADREALYTAESDLVMASKARDDGNLIESSRLIERAQQAARRLGDRSLDARSSLLAVEIAKDRGDTETASLEATAAWSAASLSGDPQLTMRAQLALLQAGASRDRRSVEAFSGLGDVPESADGARMIAAHGDALMASAKFAEGEAAYRRAQVIREKVLPPGHVEIALGKLRIGAALAIQKKAAEALAVLKPAFAEVEKAFPPLRRETIDGLRYLAMTEEQLGNGERALELYEDIYQRRSKVLGPRQGLTLEAKKDVAGAKCDLGRAKECITDLEDVIAGFVDLYGDRTTNVANARVSLANHLISAGRIAEADALLAKANPSLLKVYGPDSPYAMVGEYAQLRSWTERPKPIKLDEATAALDRIEPVFTKLFGADSQPMSAVLHSRARIAFAKGDAKSADELMVKSLALVKNKIDREEGERFHATVLRALKRDVPYDVKPPPVAAAPDVATKPAPAPSTPCAKTVDRAMIDIWPAGERDRILGWWNKEPEQGDQIVAMIDRYVDDWKGAAAAACAANSAQRQLCLARVRERLNARIMNAGNGTKRALTTRNQLPDIAACASAKETLPPNDEARERIEKGEYYLEFARVAVEIKWWTQAHRDLAYVRDQLREYNDESLAARAAKLEADIKTANPNNKKFGD